MVCGVKPEFWQFFLTGSFCAAVASILVGLLTRQTARQANAVAENKLLLEKEDAERKALQTERDEWRRERDELRAERDKYRERCATQDEENDRLRKQRNTYRAQLESLEERVAVCRRAGIACKVVPLPMAETGGTEPPTQPEGG